MACWQQLDEVSVILNLVLLLWRLIFGKLEPLRIEHQALLLFGKEKTKEDINLAQGFHYANYIEVRFQLLHSLLIECLLVRFAA